MVGDQLASYPVGPWPHSFVSHQQLSTIPVQLPSKYHHHQWFYSPGWALASSSKCRQWPLSWAAASQFLQPSFLMSSSIMSIHLPSKYIFLNLFNGICTDRSLVVRLYNKDWGPFFFGTMSMLAMNHSAWYKRSWVAFTTTWLENKADHCLHLQIKFMFFYHSASVLITYFSLLGQPDEQFKY